MTQPRQPDPYQRRPIDIDAYAPPRRGGGGWWLVVVGAVLLAAVLAALWLRPPMPGGTSPTPTPAATADAAGPGMPFTMPGTTVSHGRWEITDHRWTPQGVVLRVKVSADGGRVSYGFAAFSNKGSNSVYEPTSGAPDPQLGTGVLTAGQSIEGHLLIPLPHGDSTLILTTEAGRQMSALPIPA